MKKVALIALIFLIIGVIGVITFGGSIFSIGPKNTLDEVKQVNGAGISNLAVEVDVGDINVTESQDDKINIHLHGNVGKSILDRVKFEVEEKADTLVITVDTKGDSWGFSISDLFNFNDFGTMALDIELPKKDLSNLDVASNVGNVTIEQVNVKRLKALSDVGDVSVGQLTTELATVSSNVGDVIVTDGVGEIDIETDTGEVELTMEEVTEDIFVKSDIGDVDVRIKNPSTDLIFDLQSDIGDVTVENFNEIGDYSGKNLLVEIGQGGPKLEVTTDIGDISVKYE